MNRDRIGPIAIVYDGDVIYIYCYRLASLTIEYLDKISDGICIWPSFFRVVRVLPPNRSVQRILFRIDKILPITSRASLAVTGRNTTLLNSIRYLLLRVGATPGTYAIYSGSPV